MLFQTDIASEETHGPQMMAVTSNNKLLIVDLVSGRCLKEVQVLGSRYTRLKCVPLPEFYDHIGVNFVCTFVFCDFFFPLIVYAPFHCTMFFHNIT